LTRTKFGWLLPQVEVFADGVVHGAADGGKGVGEMREDGDHGEFLGQDVPAGGVEVGDDHAFVEVETGGSTAFGAAFEEVRVEAGEDEELIGALDVEEEALVSAGAVDGVEVVVAVEAFDLAFGFLAAAAGTASVVRADDGDVVGDGDFGDADAFEGVADDDEEEEFGGEKGGAIADDEVFEELGVIQDEGDGLRVLAEVREALLAPVGEGEGLKDEVPIRLGETEPTAWTREVCHYSWELF
jgi:hypothetical protein